ncbi:LacI family DNA-binding transcriptional regulator [Kribbella sandramycini]|uniref:LacI family DNA-binding transcriptional regulator n=1 Tax=Kribbella sandramycini TaxID=60450 RepID=A0A7Y4NY57_9ACTN|nr:LacI family DNA-binding transcriptional regulator [Kribbella sandramycini]MBB6570000.1 LacI family transcriptional regulator [Kribbella sandramycini]NOL40176.1 LacI family DNA-binding transcriptional regulator [Kribbella sandramycini]
MPRPRGAVTLATVATTAGVSIATVSKVLNGRSDVSSSTRARVQEVLTQHGYVGRRPEPVSRPTVELFYQGFLSSYSVEVIQGVVAAGQDAEVDVVLNAHPRHPNGPAGRASRWIRELIAGGRRAAIGITSELTDADLAALSRARLPLVVIDPANIPEPDVTSVGSTNFAGGMAATQHLLELGHRRIGYLGGPPTSGCNQARMSGFRSAMDAAGAAVPKQYVRLSEFLYDDGVAGGSALLDLPDRPTAIFAGSDEVALGVLEAARARGLRVPEDLSVVGFDDTQVARLASPPLTTVKQPLREMGAVALRTALRLAAGETVDSHHVELATTLIVRGSAAAIPCE